METKELTVPTINDLPNEILVMIMHRMPFADRLRMSAVCRRLNQLLFNFFAEEIELKLNEHARYRVPIGKLLNRVYRNISVIWNKKHKSSKWLEVVEEFAPGLESLSINIVSADQFVLSQWNPPASSMVHLGQTLSKLKALKSFAIGTTTKSYLAISDVIYGLANLEDLTVRINVDCAPFPYSNFNGLCRLPELREVTISSFEHFLLPEGHTLTPAPLVEDLYLDENLSPFNFTILSKLFPSLKLLDVRQVEMTDEELQELISVWPNLEVLVLGLCPTFLETFKPEMLHQLPKLRKLALSDIADEDPLLQSCYWHEEPENPKANFSLLKSILQIPTLEEIYLDDRDDGGLQWTGEIPKTRLSCRLYINEEYVPRGGKNDVDA